MTELQSCLFSILRAFDSVCKTLEIPYFLVCGSALGAVKYQGFIPWDDDLDVAMYRADYERFLRQAPALLPEHLFLQSAASDPAFPQIYAKLRDSRTTFVEHSVRHLKMHHGVFLDVFPLDGYPQSPAKQRRLERGKRLCSAILLAPLDVPRSRRARLFAAVLRALGASRATARTVRRYTKLISAYPPEEGALLCNHGNWQGVLEYSPREHYGAGHRAVFEGMEVLVPEDYDAYLSRKYGDWRAELPAEEQVSHHACAACDLTRPYTEYRSENG